MRTAKFSDEEILQACREISGKGIDPTYRSLRAAGFPCDGARLRTIRDAAVAEGRLKLPSNSRVLANVAQSLLYAKATEPVDRSCDIKIPTTLREFLKVENRTFRTWKCKRKVAAGGLWNQFAFFFSEMTPRRRKRATHMGPKWIRTTKASKPSGQQTQFETVAG